MGQRFVLTGPHAGKTMNVNGLQFVDGVLDVNVSGAQVGVLTRVLSYYGALPEAEAELAELKAKKAEPSEGMRLVQSREELDAVKQSGKPTLGEAIGALDPENDKHWTSNNLPALDVLEELTGKKVARDEVNAVAEGYTRAKARAAKQ